MIRPALLAALALGASALAEEKGRGPEAQCHDDYTECVETCEIDHGMDEGKKKLKKCLKRCAEDREECLDRFRTPDDVKPKKK